MRFTEKINFPGFPPGIYVSVVAFQNNMKILMFVIFVFVELTWTDPAMSDCNHLEEHNQLEIPPTIFPCTYKHFRPIALK